MLLHMACDHQINEQLRNYFLMEIRQQPEENENENVLRVESKDWSLESRN